MIVSGVKSNATLSISWKKFRIGRLTSNTSNPSYPSPMLTGLQRSQICSDSSQRPQASIKDQIEQRGRELDSWEELVKKTVGACAKSGLQLTSFVREMDQRCLRGNRHAHTTTVRAPTQGLSSMRDLRAEKLKSKTRGPGDEPSHSDEPSSRFEKVGETSDKKSRKPGIFILSAKRKLPC